MRRGVGHEEDVVRRGAGQKERADGLREVRELLRALLRLHVVRQLFVHQEKDGEGICGTPRLGLAAQEGELQPQAPRRVPPEDLELEGPVAGSEPPLRLQGVLYGRNVDRGDTAVGEVDGHVSGQPRKSPSLVPGEIPLPENEEDETQEEDDGGDSGEGAEREAALAPPRVRETGKAGPPASPRTGPRPAAA